MNEMQRIQCIIITPDVIWPLLGVQLLKGGAVCARACAWCEAALVHTASLRSSSARRSASCEHRSQNGLSFCGSLQFKTPKRRNNT